MPSKIKAIRRRDRHPCRTVISNDGNTMTVASKGTNAEGKAFDNTLVYDKQ
jgi:hypothetical protein